MEYLGSIWVSVSIFFISFIIFYCYFRNSVVTKKKLGIVDIIWQSTLFCAVIFATIGVRKYQNTWQFEQNKKFTVHWYHSLIRDLNWDLLNLEEMQKRAVIANWNSKDEYKEAIKWTNHKKVLLEKNKDSILLEFDKEKWDEINSQFTSFINTDGRKMLGDHEYYIQCTEFITTGLSDTIENKKKLKYSNIEGVLFYIYPWLLSLILGLRISKTVFTTFNNKLIK